MKKPNTKTAGVEVGRQAVATPASIQNGLSIWWIIIPTVIYAILTMNLNMTLVLAGIGVALRFAQTRPQLPENVRAYLPLLQLLAVFTVLGGNPFVVAGVAVAAVVAFRQRDRIIKALDPWWRAQGQYSRFTRRLLAVVLTLATGYFFGGEAGGNEWTYSFISIVIGTVVTFLLVFNPSDTLRSPAGRSST